jgi:hypothetical protein
MKKISKHFEVLGTGQIFGSYDGTYHVLRDRRISRKSSCMVREHPEDCVWRSQL